MDLNELRAEEMRKLLDCYDWDMGSRFLSDESDEKLTTVLNEAIAVLVGDEDFGYWLMWERPGVYSKLCVHDPYYPHLNMTPYCPKHPNGKTEYAKGKRVELYEINGEWFCQCETGGPEGDPIRHGEYNEETLKQCSFGEGMNDLYPVDKIE